jgi:hypothetical protein
MDDDSDPEFQTFAMPRRPADLASFTHTTWAFRRISKKFGLYVECGVARLPACPHCGASADADAKVFLDRLPIGGFAGGLLMRAKSEQPPELAPEYPGQGAFDEKEILPET